MVKAKSNGKHSGGRPSIYTHKLGLKICKLLASGQSLRSICKDPKMPNRSTVVMWHIEGKYPEFSNQYEKARETQAELMFEDIVHISDEGDKEHTNRDRLRVDVRKWYLSKVLPKKYGDKTEKDININIDMADKIHKARMRIDPTNRIFN